MEDNLSIDEFMKDPIEMFGYECGAGWLPLIEEAKKLIDEWNESHENGSDTWGGEKLQFVQVKEKWGELCIYLNFYPDHLYEKLLELSERSHHICEECGSTDNVSIQDTHGWFMALCPKCREKEMKKWEAFHHEKYEPITTTKFEVEFELPNIEETKNENN